MAKLTVVIVFSMILVGVECTSNEIPPPDDCSCASVSSEIEDMKNILMDLQEQISRKDVVCPSGFEYLPGAEACYKVIFQSLDWYASSQVCKSVMPGVHLAAITSAEKQRAIENYLVEQFNKTESSVCPQPHWPAGGKSVWISGQTKDQNRCGTPYVWKTLNAIEIPFNYTNWLAGEPNCLRNVERCAHVVAGRDYGWNDSQCSLLSCALCEF